MVRDQCWWLYDFHSFNCITIISAARSVTALIVMIRVMIGWFWWSLWWWHFRYRWFDGWSQKTWWWHFNLITIISTRRSVTALLVMIRLKIGWFWWSMLMIVLLSFYQLITIISARRSVTALITKHDDDIVDVDNGFVIIIIWSPSSLLEWLQLPWQWWSEWW